MTCAMTTHQAEDALVSGDPSLSPQEKRKARKTICEHNRRKTQCVRCYDLGVGGGSICPHRKRKDGCLVCRSAGGSKALRQQVHSTSPPISAASQPFYDHSRPAFAQDARSRPTSVPSHSFSGLIDDSRADGGRDPALSLSSSSSTSRKCIPFTIDAILGTHTTTPPMTPTTLIHLPPSINNRDRRPSPLPAFATPSPSSDLPVDPVAFRRRQSDGDRRLSVYQSSAALQYYPPLVPYYAYEPVAPQPVLPPLSFSLPYATAQPPTSPALGHTAPTSSSVSIPQAHRAAPAPGSFSPHRLTVAELVDRPIDNAPRLASLSAVAAAATPQSVAACQASNNSPRYSNSSSPTEIAGPSRSTSPEANMPLATGRIE
ncbi:hypothetical protein HK405_013488 [Cladochytrium tenue]|nr:hypothetical protein HK405_013488 [Cladochytrium tenue]